MTPNEAHMGEITRELPTKSAKIRKLGEAGYKRADIARFLGIRYQHVRNVLEQAAEKASRRGAETSAPAHGLRAPVKLQLDRNGRIVIPAQYRSEMGVSEGDSLIARMVDGELRLMSQEAAVRRAQEMVAKYIPAGESLVDALIRERREEARRESGNG